MDSKMFSSTEKKSLIDDFTPPRKQRQLFSHAEAVMKGTHYKNVSNFIHTLQAEGIIRLHILKAKNGKTITLYSSSSLDEIAPYDLAAAICPEGYFCNLSSIYYHALTNQIPKTVYVCNETISGRPSIRSDTLNNNKLRSAFIKPHRHTNYVIERNDCEIVIVDRKKSSDYGVVKINTQKSLYPNNSRITCTERALIDAVVSPHYNGGIVSVYTYFKKARQKINIRKLLDIYQKLEYVYPYTQTIGFFLEKLGMLKQAAAIYDEFPPEYKFYVDHNAKTSWKFDNKWMVFYPQGLVDEN